ncbi:MAG: DUF6434 domain-containing protein [Halopseudomonas aestusnigri]
MNEFDWHSSPLTRETVITDRYKNTQNVRRFMKKECGEDFKFNRPFMAWIKGGNPKIMGDIADEWLKRQSELKT